MFPPLLFKYIFMILFFCLKECTTFKIYENLIKSSAPLFFCHTSWCLRLPRNISNKIQRKAKHQQNVVLTDWLEESVKTESELEMSREHSGAEMQSYAPVHGSNEAAPLRFQRMVRQMWDQLTIKGQLDYLPAKQREDIKRALTVLAALTSLNFNTNKEFDPEQAFQEADFNGDGELTFQEFVKWYEKSVDQESHNFENHEAASPKELLNQGASLKKIVQTAGVGLQSAYFTVGDRSLTQENLREAWLSSDTSNMHSSPGVNAIYSMQLAIETACILINIQADAPTVIAALLCSVAEIPQIGLDFMGFQFGRQVQKIIEDRLTIQEMGTPDFLSANTMQVIRSGKGVRPLMDLDDTPAKLLREYLVQTSRDPRSFVVLMAGLLGELRAPQHLTKAYSRQYKALEALQLYLPVANAMGLGGKFQELEERSYQAIFPESYSTVKNWHSGKHTQSQYLVASAKQKIMDSLDKKPELKKKIKAVEIQGRTKAVVSLFKKVFRQNKSKDDVLDLVGLRVIITPEESSQLQLENDAVDAEVLHEVSSYVPQSTDDAGEPHYPAMFTVSSYPPPYRHPQSKLLDEVYQVIAGIWTEMDGRYKNYVDFPKRNGYRSIHSTLISETGLCFEVQLRTKEMHIEAENSHQLYKGDLHSKEEAMKFQAKINKHQFLLPSPKQSDE